MKDPTNPDKRVIIPIFKIPFSTSKTGKTKIGKPEVVPVSIAKRISNWFKRKKK